MIATVPACFANRERLLYCICFGVESNGNTCIMNLCSIFAVLSPSSRRCWQQPLLSTSRSLVVLSPSYPQIPCLTTSNIARAGDTLAAFSEIDNLFKCHEPGVDAQLPKLFRFTSPLHLSVCTHALLVSHTRIWYFTLYISLHLAGGIISHMNRWNQNVRSSRET